jgi:hypothetical protein
LKPTWAKVRSPISKTSQAWCLTPIIPVTWEAKVEGSKFKANLGKITTRPYLKNKANGLGTMVQVVKW